MVGNSGHNVAVQFSGNKAIDTNIQSTLLEDLNKQYPDAGFKILESGSIDASMGFNFLLKCLTAVAIASILMVIYVTLRFKKIGRSFSRCYSSYSTFPRCYYDLLYVCNLPYAD